MHLFNSRHTFFFFRRPTRDFFPMIYSVASSPSIIQGIMKSFALVALLLFAASFFLASSLTQPLPARARGYLFIANQKSPTVLILHVDSLRLVGKAAVHANDH